MRGAVYNENNPAAVHILRHMIATGVIAPGDVDDRSIVDVGECDYDGYSQVHLFAGGGFWSVAARQAGWEDERFLWTVSCPCQPFSSAGKLGGTDDPRHLWPHVFRLLRSRRQRGLLIPPIVGEQVASKAGIDWFDGIRADMGTQGIRARSVVFPACAVNAPHQRQRQYWFAISGDMADATGDRRFNGHQLSDAVPGSQPIITGARWSSADVAGMGAVSGMAHTVGTGQEMAWDTAGQCSAGSCRPLDRGSGSDDHDRRQMVDTARIGRSEGITQSDFFGRVTTVDGTDAPVSYCQWFSCCADPNKCDDPNRCIYGNGGPSGARWDDDDGWVVGDTIGTGWQGQCGNGDGSGRPHTPRSIAAADGGGVGAMADTDQPFIQGQPSTGQFAGTDAHVRIASTEPTSGYVRNPWTDAEWITCHDGKKRRTKPGIRLLVNGLSGRVDLWSVAGNAIVPEAAVQVIAAVRDVLP